MATRTRLRFDEDPVPEVLQEAKDVLALRQRFTLFGHPLDPIVLPSLEQLRVLVDVAFWASLGRDEGRSVPFRLIFDECPDHSGSYRLASAVSFSAENLRKLAVGVFHDELAIYVAANPDDQLLIHGFATSHGDTFELSSDRPGEIAVTCSGRNIAVIGGGTVSVLVGDNVRYNQALWQKLLPELFRTRQNQFPDPTWVLQNSPRIDAILHLARKVRALEHGGTLIFLQKGEPTVFPRPDSQLDVNKIPGVRTPILFECESWFQYANDPLLDTLKLQAEATDMRNASVEDEVGKQDRRKRLEDARAMLDRSLDAIACLSAVDGSVVLSHDLNVVAFGVRLERTSAGEPLRSVTAIESTGVLDFLPIGIEQLGGTRHQSAAQFADDCPEAVVIVVSQDGNVTILYRDDANVIAIRHVENSLF